jgi:hypothetical protein
MAEKDKTMGTPFKMKGSTFLKDIKLYQGDGSQITIDDTNLSEVYRDDDGNEARDYTYTNKDGEESTDTFYLDEPRFGKSKEGPVLPSNRLISEERQLG